MYMCTGDAELHTLASHFCVRVPLLAQKAVEVGVDDIPGRASHVKLAPMLPITAGFQPVSNDDATDDVDFIVHRNSFATACVLWRRVHTKRVLVRRIIIHNLERFGFRRRRHTIIFVIVVMSRTHSHRTATSPCQTSRVFCLRLWCRASPAHSPLSSSSSDSSPPNSSST